MPTHADTINAFEAIRLARLRLDRHGRPEWADKALRMWATPGTVVFNGPDDATERDMLVAVDVALAAGMVVRERNQVRAAFVGGASVHRTDAATVRTGPASSRLVILSTRPDSFYVARRTEAR